MSHSHKSKFRYRYLIILGIFITWSIGTLIFWLVNGFAYLGATFIMIADYISSPFTIIGIGRPEIGWLLLGCILGAILGLIQALKRTGRSYDVYKVYIVAATIFLMLQAVAYSQRQSQFDTSAFQSVVLQENFTSPKDWVLADGAVIKDGGLLQLQPEGSKTDWSIWNGRSFSDVDFSAEIKKVNGSDNIYFGLLARVNGDRNDNFYYLKIDGNGNFVMGKHLKDKWEDRVGSRETDILYMGNDANRLRLVCNGNLIIGFINERLVGIFRDTSYKSGKIAVQSARGEESAVAVYFDNVLVKEKSEQM